MSNELSRRDFFAFLASPLTRVSKRVAASEQRAQALQSLQPNAQANCARCYAPFNAESNETLCPDCRAADAKNNDLVRSLFKPK
jgi:Zn finger protein HypA/HybF involved in hydrogenase expression